MIIFNSEDDLCKTFAEAIRGNRQFAITVLQSTKFADRAAHSSLLYDELVSARPKVLPERWWRHWWCTVPELGQGRETDIFLVFEDDRDKLRYALHVEAKIDARFTSGQAHDYLARAKWMANQNKYLNYSDFTTILLCPMEFAARHPSEAAQFSTTLFVNDVLNWMGMSVRATDQ